jgi:dTMP kinase
MTKSNRGLLIDVEGIDGSGKTTHINLIKNWLESLGCKVITLKEPTQGKYGSLIAKLASEKNLSSEQELDLFIKDREEDVTNNIIPALDAGEIVIMDRYYYSNIAYQAARGLDPANIKEINEKFAPGPDLIIVLDIDPRIGMVRVNERKNKVEHFENVTYLEKVRKQFLKIGKQSNAILIETDKPIDKVQKDIENAIKDKLPSIVKYCNSNR